MKKWIILIIALLIGGCGYHLRGAFELPKDLGKIYLQGGSAKFREQFNKVLEDSSGKLVKSADDAQVTVRVFDNDIKQRSLSLGQSGRSNEFELHYQIQYEFRDAANNILLERQPLDIRREYFNDQQDIIAKDNEEGVIRSEIYQQAVRTIFSRMGTLVLNKTQ